MVPESNIPTDARVTAVLKILDEGWGHHLSFKEQKPIDANGNPLPWFTYPSIEYLQQINLRDATILEWGMGNSTLFFAKRCLNIYSIEHNESWFNAINGSMPANATAFLTSTGDEYINRAFSIGKKFDIIIVDGINRADCLNAAMQLHKEDGLIIFDNSDRNPELCEVLRNNDFIQVDFHGFGPINPYTWTTSIFFGRTNKLIPLSQQPLIPIGGGY